MRGGRKGAERAERARFGGQGGWGVTKGASGWFRHARSLLSLSLSLFTPSRARPPITPPPPLPGESSSDPQATIEFDGTKATSECIKKNLNPLWKQRFSFPLRQSWTEEGAMPLRVVVEDVDVASSNDFMGQTKAIDTHHLTKQ